MLTLASDFETQVKGFGHIGVTSIPNKDKELLNRVD
jgi:hypothetical protein